MDKQDVVFKVGLAVDYELSIIENGISDGTTEKLTMEQAIEIVMDGVLFTTYFSEDPSTVKSGRDWELIAGLYSNELIIAQNGEKIKPSAELVDTIDHLVTKNFSHILKPVSDESTDPGDCPNCGGDCLREASSVELNLDLVNERVEIIQGDNIIDLPIPLLVDMTKEVLAKSMMTKFLGDLFE